MRIFFQVMIFDSDLDPNSLLQLHSFGPVLVFPPIAARVVSLFGEEALSHAMLAALGQPHAGLMMLFHFSQQQPWAPGLWLHPSSSRSFPPLSGGITGVLLPFLPPPVQEGCDCGPTLAKAVLGCWSCPDDALMLHLCLCREDACGSCRLGLAPV